MSSHHLDIIPSLRSSSNVIPSFRCHSVIPSFHNHSVHIHTPPPWSYFIIPSSFESSVCLSIIPESFYHSWVIPRHSFYPPWPCPKVWRYFVQTNIHLKSSRNDYGMRVFVLRRSFHVRTASDDRDEGWDYWSHLIIILFEMTLEWWILSFRPHPVIRDEGWTKWSRQSSN